MSGIFHKHRKKEIEQCNVDYKQCQKSDLFFAIFIKIIQKECQRLDKAWNEGLDKNK